MATDFRRQQQIRGSTEDWATDDLVLLVGEIGIEMTTPPRQKVGDGVNPWSLLPYLGEADEVARAAITSLETFTSGLDLRLIDVETAIPGLASQSSVDALTTDVAGKQDAIPVGANPGDLIMWDGAWGPVLLTLVSGSMIYWNGTAYVAVPAGSPGQALVWDAGNFPRWTTNPAAGVEEADNDGRMYVRQSEAWSALALLSMGIVSYTGTGRALLASDAGKRVRCTNAGTITMVIPDNATVPFPIGSVIEFEQVGAGQVVLDPTAVTLTHRAIFDPETDDQYSIIRLVKVATDGWTLEGDLDPV